MRAIVSSSSSDLQPHVQPIIDEPITNGAMQEVVQLAASAPQRRDARSRPRNSGRTEGCLKPGNAALGDAKWQFALGPFVDVRGEDDCSDGTNRGRRAIDAMHTNGLLAHSLLMSTEATVGSEALRNMSVTTKPWRAHEEYLCVHGT